MGNIVEKDIGNNLSKVNPDTTPALPWLNKQAVVYVYSVTDGDTLKVLMERNNDLFKFDILLNGVKTPRIMRCSELEKKAGMKVKEYVKTLVEEKTVIFCGKRLDNFANRIYGDVMFDSSFETKINLGTHLVKKGYATCGKWSEKELEIILDN